MFDFIKKIINKNNSEKKNNINEWSYQRYGKFYDERIFPDPNFQDKINKIIFCIKEKKLERLEEIAYESGCTVEETVMKIRYLENKKAISNIYIDRVNKVVKKCSEDDEKLLEKYYNYLYINHYSVKEIAQNIPNYYKKPTTIIEEDVYKDIKYLYDRCIINGIKLDEYNKEIIYYTIEKHKKAVNYATINCTKCGALVDVSRGGNGRCDYCGSIVEDTTN